MLSNLSPSERQIISALFSLPPSSKIVSDPYLSSRPKVQTLEPYKRLEEWFTSFKQRDQFFTFPRTQELKDYADVKQFHRVHRLEYTAPPLTSNDKEVINSLELKRRRLAAEGYDTAVIDIMTRSEADVHNHS
ncbi:hypothetical protein FBU30_008651 [Linnemannia zychae]|nr:hypothetical protein FBU30_008651 [Linnemannia zychae]